MRRYIHCHVLQRAERQIRDETDVRLLSRLGARVGVPQEGHPARNQALRRRHHQSARGRDGPVLLVLPARAQERRLRRHILPQIEGQDHGRKRPQVRRRLRHLLQNRQVSYSYPTLLTTLLTCFEQRAIFISNNFFTHPIFIFQVYPHQGAPRGVQSASHGQRRGLGQHAQPSHAQGQHRTSSTTEDQGEGLGQR